jgi:hypothetical protein
MFLFVWRNVGRYKQHLPQRVAGCGGLSQCQMSAVDGVEGAAEKTYIHSGIPCFVFAVTALWPILKAMPR